MELNKHNAFKDLKCPDPVRMLSSGLPALDALLGGGLREGELSEWGLPWGQGLRSALLPLLAQAQQQYGYWILWIYGHEQLQINPWAWHAQSIDLQRMRFARSRRPFEELKPIFLSDFFRVLVLDQLTELSEKECQHLARAARQQKQTILVLRSQPLTHDQGNLWSRQRLNLSLDPQQKTLEAHLLKGGEPRRVTLPWPLTSGGAS